MKQEMELEFVISTKRAAVPTRLLLQHLISNYGNLT